MYDVRFNIIDLVLKAKATVHTVPCETSVGWTNSEAPRNCKIGRVEPIIKNPRRRLAASQAQASVHGHILLHLPFISLTPRL